MKVSAIQIARLSWMPYKDLKILNKKIYCIFVYGFTSNVCLSIHRLSYVVPLPTASTTSTTCGTLPPKYSDLGLDPAPPQYDEAMRENPTPDSRTEPQLEEEEGRDSSVKRKGCCVIL